MGFPGGSDSKASARNAWNMGSIPGSGKSPWRRKWQPTPVFLPGKSHGQRNMVGYSPWGHKESDTIEWLNFHILHYFNSLIVTLSWKGSKRQSKNRSSYSKLFSANRVTSVSFVLWDYCVKFCVNTPKMLCNHCTLIIFSKLSSTMNFVVVVQSLSCVGLFAIPWPAALQASLSLTISRSLFKLMSIESAMPFNLTLTLTHPLSSTSPLALNLSQRQGLFQSCFLTSGGRNIGVSASIVNLQICNKLLSSL